MEWQLKTAPASTGEGIVAPCVLAHGSIPVLLGSTGRYAEFVSEAGESSAERPHVKVSFAEAMSQGPQGIDRWVGSVYVEAVGALEDGRRKTLRAVSQQCQPARSEADIQALIDSLAPHIANALDLCSRIDEVYAGASQRLAVIKQVEGQCATREGYEAACNTAEVEALPDEEIIQSYGIAYGHFSFPEYSPDVIIKMALAHRRMMALKKEAEAEVFVEAHAPAATLAKGGQLWEPCRCGKEPVYMPLHLCDACWPREA